MNHKQLVLALTLTALIIAAVPTALPTQITKADNVVVGYVTLSSFDFLSSSEVSNFNNLTLAGSNWNTTLTSYSVSNGLLNVTNKDSSDAMLVYPETLNGYADVKFTAGAIGVFSNYNSSATNLAGYEVVKDSNGITVYEVNGTSKTALASYSTTSDEVMIYALDGDFKVTLPDGTNIYTGSIGNAVLALGAPANTNASFDKLMLYGIYLSGDTSVSLGSKTLTGTTPISFSYDVSKYNPTSIKASIKMVSNDDPYARYFAICTKDFSSVSTWWKQDLSSYGELKSGIVMNTLTVDVPLSSSSGTLYVGISSMSGSWTVTVTIALSTTATSTPSDTNTEVTTTSSNKLSLHLSSNAEKYLAIGAFVVVLLIIAVAMMAGGGRRRRGMLSLLAVMFMVLLILGGVAAAVLAWLHPEWLTAVALGLGALAIITLLILIGAPGKIPNPAHPQ